MNQQQQQKPRSQNALKSIAQLFPNALNYLSDESRKVNTSALEENLRQRGANEESISFLTEQVFPVLRKAAQDTEASAKLNRAILGGTSLLNLILLPLLGAAGRGDFPLSLAWIALVCSLPCTAAALYLSTMAGKIKNLMFPLVYGLASWISLLGCGTAITAFIWHQWNVAGWLFMILATLLFLLSTFYDNIQRVRHAADMPNTSVANHPEAAPGLKNTPESSEIQ